MDANMRRELRLQLLNSRAITFPLVPILFTEGFLIRIEGSIRCLGQTPRSTRRRFQCLISA